MQQKYPLTEHLEMLGSLFMIKINIEKAKAIAHDKRRQERQKEFAPYDIKATIPAEASDAELQRQQIRQKYAVMQNQIDAAATADEIKIALRMT